MNFWTWGGKYIDCEEEGILYSYRGTPIGKFYGEELYDFNGKYIGEIKGSNRLIVNLSKKGYTKPCICTPSLHSVTTHYSDYGGYAIYAGYADFSL